MDEAGWKLCGGRFGAMVCWVYEATLPADDGGVAAPQKAVRRGVSVRGGGTVLARPLDVTKR